VLRWPPTSGPTARARFGVHALVHQDDFLFKFLVDGASDRGTAVNDYFANGSDSAQKLARIVFDDLGVSRGVYDRFRLVEFASGYGMVTRHINNYLPNADVVSYDIHPQAVEFTSKIIGTPKINEADDPASVIFGLRPFYLTTCQSIMTACEPSA